MTEPVFFRDLLTGPVNHGYSPDLSPGLLRAVLLLRNVDPGRADVRCLTLGPGDGLSAVFHAAALPGEWWLAAPDPDHALRARALADVSGADLRIVDGDLGGPDWRGRMGRLPDFDLILAPALWSAGRDEERGLLLQLVRNHLKPGGSLLVTYDALPGCGDLLPLRDLLLLHGLLTGNRSESPAERTTRAFAHLTALDAAGAALFRDAPHRRETLARLAALPEAQRNLLFDPAWRPWHFADVERTLHGGARLSYAASPRLLHAHDALCAPPAHQELLSAVDPALRETTRDALLNTRTRADIFVKGSRTLPLEERIAAVSRLTFMLTRPMADFAPTLDLPGGPQRLNEAVYRPLLAVLAENDFAPKSVEELEDHPLLQDLDSAPLIDMLSVLMGLGALHPCVAASEQKREACARLNACLMERAASDPSSTWLVSPTIGSGVRVPRLEQLFLRAMAHAAGSGEEWTPEDWGTDAWIAISSHGERLWRDDRALDFSEAEAAVIAMARTFGQERLPLLTALGITPGAERPDAGR